MAKILKENVLKRLGHNFGKGSLTAPLDEMIDEELRLSEKLIVPNKIMRLSGIDSNNGKEVILSEELTIKSSHVAKLLHECHSAYGFAVTIGKALEEKRDSYLLNKERIRALLLDSIGSVAVEDFAESATKEIEDIAMRDNFSITRRFSPGYGDWVLQNQKEFLEWLEAEKINIHLTAHFMMTPEKSISAIVGVRKEKL
jgi:cobalamin-dependent methionine synthase I